MPVVSVNQSFMCEVGERCPSTAGFTGTILFFFLYLTWQKIRCKKLITKLIFHQIPLLPGCWENIHLMPNYVWDLGGRMWCGGADWQVGGNCVCVWHTAGTACYLTACSHEEATWTHTSTALSAVSANRLWDWSCVTRFPSPTTSFSSLQHHNSEERASYGMVDRSLLLRWDLAWHGVN